MIDLRHSLAVLARQPPWDQIEQALAPKASNAGRPRLSIRLMASLLYLKNAFNLSDEELVRRWRENVQYQFFSGMGCYEPRLPSDAAQIGRFRRAIGEEGMEHRLKSTIDAALEI
jgi:IS5 family transposase